MAVSPPLLLFDGECGLCDRTVQFLLERDSGGPLRFAPLQGETAAPLLARHALGPVQGDGFATMVLVQDLGGPRERTLQRSDAALALARYLGGRWRALARFGQLVPRALRDGLYRLIAHNRHRLFAPPSTCKVMSKEERARFLP